MHKLVEKRLNWHSPHWAAAWQGGAAKMLGAERAMPLAGGVARYAKRPVRLAGGVGLDGGNLAAIGFVSPLHFAPFREMNLESAAIQYAVRTSVNSSTIRFSRAHFERRGLL